MSEQSIAAQLQEPFPIEDVKWRVQRSGLTKGGKPWVVVQPYITSRAIQTRLDDVLGIDGWEVFQHETLSGDGFICTLKLFINGKWVTKQDVAQKTDIEALKGGASGALKRAGALAGIGRYLYRLKPEMASVFRCDNRYEATNYMTVYENPKDKKNSNFMHVDWLPPVLPDWARPGLDSSEFSNAIKGATLVMSAEIAFVNACNWASSFSRKDLVELFTKEKNEAVARLEDEAKSNVASRFNEVDKWLDGQIKNINAVPDPDAVHKVGEQLRANLYKKCEGQYFDKETLYTKLKNAVLDRVNNLNK